MPKRKLPVDFEKKVKQARSPNGTGYPYQISAKDLMEDFKYLLELMPEGNQGDMLYWSGDAWTLLKAPSGGIMHVLSHDGSKPVWVETQECEA
jgi:hypothetical protein